MPATALPRLGWRAAVLGIVLGGLSGAAPLAAQSSMYRGDPAHSGVYAGTAAAEFGGVRWRFQTDGPVRSTPAVVDGVVFVGSSDGHVYALDAATGEQRWRFDAGSPVTSSPAVARGLVIVGSRAGRWFGLDVASGAVRWQLQEDAELPLPWGHESGDYWTSSATIAGDAALLAGGDGVLRAVDVATGQPQWTARAPGRMRASPAVAGGLVVAGDAQGTISAFDLATGSLRWRYETEGHTLRSELFGFDRRTIQSSPAILDGRVFVGARDGFLYALDARTGSLLWRFDHHVSWVNTFPAAEAGRVYAGSSDRQFVQAVDARTGRELWRDTTALTWASPAVSGDRVYAGDGAGFITAMDKITGAVEWKWAAASGIFSSPVALNGVLYVGSDDGAVYRLDIGAAHVLHRAVYWDSTLARTSLVGGAAAIRDWFAYRGYEPLNAAALTSFLESRLADREPSVIVFANDVLPPAVASSSDTAALLRRYLDAGGTAVWPGVPPLLFPADPRTGDRDLLHIGREPAARLLGVTFERSLFDRNGTSLISPAGRRLGLKPNFLSGWSADPASVTTVLATDEMGLASAWVRSYGGPPGTGFIRIPSIGAGAGGVADLLVLQMAGELRGPPTP